MIVELASRLRAGGAGPPSKPSATSSSNSGVLFARERADFCWKRRAVVVTICHKLPRPRHANNARPERISCTHVGSSLSARRGADDEGASGWDAWRRRVAIDGARALRIAARLRTGRGAV